MEFIPKRCEKKSNIELRNKLTEWRWLIYEINQKKYMEISMKKPNEERLYVTKNNQFVKRNIDESFNKYIIDQFYYYPKEE
jgi:hypothetical protein